MKTPQLAKLEFEEGNHIPVGEPFHNEDGEEFRLYRIEGIQRIYITGDELDWETGWVWTPGGRMVQQEFVLSSEEAKAAYDVAYKAMQKDLGNFS